MNCLFIFAIMFYRCRSGKETATSVSSSAAQGEGIALSRFPSASQVSSSSSLLDQGVEVSTSNHTAGEKFLLQSLFRFCHL